MAMRENLGTEKATTATPGRPRNFDSEEILDRALELFWKNGFANTTTRELENELSLNQSSMYNTFGSKEQFFNSVLDRYETLTNEALIQPLESTDAGIVALERYFSDLTDWITRDGRRGCMLINMMAEDGGQNPGFTARSGAYRKRVTNAIQRVLEGATEKQEIKAGDNTARALVLIGLTLGLNIAARACASRQELDQLTSAIHQQINTWRKIRGQS